MPPGGAIAIATGRGTSRSGKAARIGPTARGFLGDQPRCRWTGLGEPRAGRRGGPRGTGPPRAAVPRERSAFARPRPVEAARHALSARNPREGRSGSVPPPRGTIRPLWTKRWCGGPLDAVRGTPGGTRRGAGSPALTRNGVRPPAADRRGGVWTQWTPTHPIRPPRRGLSPHHRRPHERRRWHRAARRGERGEAASGRRGTPVAGGARVSSRRSWRSHRRCPDIDG